MIFPAFCGGALTCCLGDSHSICRLLSAKKCPYPTSKFSFNKYRFSLLMRHTNMLVFFSYIIVPCIALNLPKMLLLPTIGNGGGRKSRQEQTQSLSPSWRVHRWTLKFHPCDCQCLVGPWVTEKKSCPQGYVCILERRWNSIGNVLSAVMLSFIYTLSSFDFWDVAAVSPLIPSLP